ncbi:MAG: hypothetical protein SF052_20120 [Bacteroidia bacterium]|nr:hypothetical protein [Bacteroidia bacterium]
MKKLVFLPFLFLSLSAFPNAAQPGFWNAGGTGTFSLLYPEDSAEYRKIQMVWEKVAIQLYRGYAVIKGEYRMYNETSEAVSIRVGYPLNASFDGRTANREEIHFDSLYALKAQINGQQVEIISQPVNDVGASNDNWYVWNTVFPPGDTTVIEVYFIVNTNETRISEGYGKDYNNGFIYLLETGATWKQPVVQGEIRLRLMEELVADHLRGVSPDSVFLLHKDAKTMVMEFHNLSPSGEDNIIIAYTPNLKNFDFASVITQKEVLFQEIDRFAQETFTPENFELHTFGDPFEVSSSAGWWIGVVFFLVVYGIPLLAIFIIIIAGYKILHSIRKKKTPS